MSRLNRTWFVHLQGQNFGPLTSEVVVLMIQQKRLEYWDFIWTQGLDSWARIADMMPFSEMLPPYPVAPLPGEAGEATLPTPQPPTLATPAPSSEPQNTTPPPAPTAEATKEKRAMPRVGIRRHNRSRIQATVAVEGYGNYEAYDIAEGGVFLLAIPIIALGTDIKFKLTSKSFPKTLSMTGIVIREGKTEDGKPGFAIQFTRVNPAHSRMIRDYAQSHKS